MPAFLVLVQDDDGAWSAPENVETRYELDARTVTVTTELSHFSRVAAVHLEDVVAVWLGPASFAGVAGSEWEGEAQLILTFDISDPGEGIIHFGGTGTSAFASGAVSAGDALSLSYAASADNDLFGEQSTQADPDDAVRVFGNSRVFASFSCVEGSGAYGFNVRLSVNNGITQALADREPLAAVAALFVSERVDVKVTVAGTAVCTAPTPEPTAPPPVPPTPTPTPTPTPRRPRRRRRRFRRRHRRPSSA